MQGVLDLQEFYTTKDDIEQVTVLDTEFHRLLLDASRKSLRYALGSMLDYGSRLDFARCGSLGGSTTRCGNTGVSSRRWRLARPNWLGANGRAQDEPDKTC